ncbi:DUF397 domain-containing protein [Nocardiopsis sp. FIRDI 009]|uniref:DUF397 domain-containing protein n=1 Tax=Nocardiopsis sp. FIRDI 009 TaxID=714197 RepID=UPI000E2385A4|nr:DUF397 domain-containing protein [Nocardiopsis sp. FIRDI 009]
MCPSANPNFRKSSYSGGQTQDCVEVADLPGSAVVRDSQHPDLSHLEVPASEWRALIATVRSA